MSVIKVALVDDHSLLLRALAKLINSFDDFNVVLLADGGAKLLASIQSLTGRNLPDILLTDINMPEVDGYQVVKAVREMYPSVKIVMLTMFSDNDTVSNFLRLGVNSYLLKNIEPMELEVALRAVSIGGAYYQKEQAKQINSLFRNNLIDPKMLFIWGKLSDQEKQFIRLSCTELTYAKISIEMGLSIAETENMRQSIFQTFSVKSRVGLALIASANNFLS